MEESIGQQRRRIAGYMAAVAHVLTGRPGDQGTFNANVELIVSGSSANTPTLLNWGERVRQTGRPVLLCSPTSQPSVPLITLVAHVDGGTHIVESCMLWMGRGQDRARLVPDGFELGAFVFDDDLQLRRVEKAPARDFRTAMPGMKRASGRLLDAEIAIRDRVNALPLPSCLQKAA